MSDNLTDDLKDANEMIGAGYKHPTTVIEPPRKVMSRRKGEEFSEVENPAWIKFSTAFKDELPDISGNALKVWIYIALSVNYKGEAWPGIVTIAKGIGLSHPTVLAGIHELEELKILTVRRGEKRYNIYNISDDYVTIGRGEPLKNLSSSDDDHESLPADHESFSSDHETRVALNKNNKKEQEIIVPEKVFTDTNRQIDAMLEQARHVKYTNRHKFPETLVPYADCFNELTGLEPVQRVIMDWLGTFSDWLGEGITVDAIRKAYDQANGKFPIVRPGSLTNLAASIQAKLKTKTQAEEYDPYAPLIFALQQKEMQDAANTRQ